MRGLRTGENRCDDLVAECEQGGDGAGRVGRYVVAAGAARFDGEALAPQFAQVVAALADGVAGLSAEPADRGGELGDGEPMRGGSRGQRGGQGCAMRGLWHCCVAPSRQGQGMIT